MRHYAIYTRQSVSRPGDILSSCDTQLQLCHEHVASRSGSSLPWIGERFDDRGFTGSTTERPALQRLLARMELGDVSLLAVYSLDRLARNLRHSLELFDILRAHGVELAIVKAPDVSDGPGSAFMLNLMATVADFERDMIRSRLADSREARKRRGLRLSGPPPYGYTIDPQTRQLIIVPEEARRLEAIFQHALDGMPPSAIADHLNELGWRTRQRRTARSDRCIGGGPWTPRQVLAVLRNPSCRGRLRDGHDQTRRGTHQPIITQETYDLVQQRIDQRKASARPTRSRTPASLWPLRQRIRCWSCERFLSPHQLHQGPTVQRHYRCRSHAGGRPPCKGVALPAAEIESRVVDILLEPGLIDEVPPEERGALQRLQEALLESPQPSSLLGNAVSEVRFDPLRSRLSVSLATPLYP